MDIRGHNRLAWDRQVEAGNEWTVPVDASAVADARHGDWKILLTPTIPMPRSWLPDLPGKRVLCLASGGGQQGPVLAAAGAKVTVLDNSPKQLQRDRLVAEREELSIATVEGDMADLHEFSDRSFDIVVHPVSNLFVPDIRPVWSEAFRVLRGGGILVSGFANPVIFLFDYDHVERTGRLEVKYQLPYSDLQHLSAAGIEQHRKEGIPLEFGHSLEDQIGGQIAAGFVINGFYEDRDRSVEDNPLREYTPTYVATRALKPAG
jgi:SAM-dependent methyltransferase